MFTRIALRTAAAVVSSLLDSRNVRRSEGLAHPEADVLPARDRRTGLKGLTSILVGWAFKIAWPAHTIRPLSYPRIHLVGRMKTRGQRENVSIAASPRRVEFLLDVLTALLMTFAAALVLIQASARYGIPADQLNFLVLSSS